MKDFEVTPMTKGERGLPQGNNGFCTHGEKEKSAISLNPLFPCRELIREKPPNSKAEKSG